MAELSSSLYQPSGRVGSCHCMVLLVDDQLLVGEVIRRMLAPHADTDYHFCHDPSQAVSIANQVKPTVILQDLVMPGVDGLAIVRKFRDNPDTIHTPIIVLSSKEDPEVKGKAFEVGANDYIVKFPDQIEMLARIRYHSMAHINRLQRDEAYRTLRESQQQLLDVNASLLATNRKLEEANQTISELARKDALTGVANRRHLDEVLSREAARMQRKETTLTVILADLDRFKSINDTFGHLIGDEILRMAATVLAKHTRPYDVIGRYGGEEFLILLDDTSLEQGAQIAERARSELKRTKFEWCPRTITASFGVATMRRGQTAAELLQRADAALYRAKQLGRDRVETEQLETNG